MDDDSSFRASLRRLLTASGYGVREAGSADSALELLTGGDFDAALLDVHMPTVGGIELLQQIRSKDYPLSVILITGEPSVGSAAEAVEHGALAYLIKPVEQSRLLEVVGRATRMTRMIRFQQAGSEVSRGPEGSSEPNARDEHARLDRALESLWLAHQPIVDANSRTLIGYELLMRQDEPSLPHPGAVLELSERLGRTRDVGRTVRRTAAACARALPSDMLVFVNLHASDLADPDLTSPEADLTAFARRTVLEVTERASLDGLSNPAGTCSRLRMLGYRLAVDDLGAGYSGLSSLPLIGPEFVKIDMSLVRSIDSDTPKRRIVAGLVSLAHELGMRVVSEGIETEPERDTLVAVGSDLLQGYLIGKPARRAPTPVL